MTDEDAARAKALAASRALPAKERIARASDVLNRAKRLRDEVRDDLRLQRFGADDVQMDEYNDFANNLAWLFPDDPVLGGGLILMPDAVLQSYGTLFPIQSMTNYLPALRLQVRLTRLINRLEEVLGVPAEEESPKPNEVGAESQGSVRPRVFISHSGESLALHRLLRFLRDLEIEPVVAEWVPFRGKPVPKHVTDTMASCVSAIVFATATDEVRGRRQPGRGVLIETGILQERFGERVVYLIEEETEFGPMADNFACEFFTQDNLEKALHRLVIEFRALGLI